MLTLRHGKGKLPHRKCQLTPYNLVSRTRGSPGTVFPFQRGMIVQILRHHADLYRGRRCRGQGGQRGRIQRGHMRHILIVHKFWQVPVLDSILSPDILVLMIEVLSPFSEADRGKALLSKGGVVSSAQGAVATKLQHRMKGRTA